MTTPPYCSTHPATLRLSDHELGCPRCAMEAADRVDMAVTTYGPPMSYRAGFPPLCPACDRWDSHSLSCPRGGLQAALQAALTASEGGDKGSALSARPGAIPADPPTQDQALTEHPAPVDMTPRYVGRPRLHKDAKAAQRAASRAYRARRRQEV